MPKFALQLSLVKKTDLVANDVDQKDSPNYIAETASAVEDLGLKAAFVIGALTGGAILLTTGCVIGVIAFTHAISD